MEKHCQIFFLFIRKTYGVSNQQSASKEYLESMFLLKDKTTR